MNKKFVIYLQGRCPHYLEPAVIITLTDGGKLTSFSGVQPEVNKSIIKVPKGRVGLMDKVSASQTRDRGFEDCTGYDQDSSNDTCTGLFQEADSRVIISCENNRA